MSRHEDCRVCRAFGRIVARGLCRACYGAAYKRGSLESVAEPRASRPSAPRTAEAVLLAAAAVRAGRRAQ